jgi:septal ring factor EnvC (AmiA/AmiB activator)
MRFEDEELEMTNEMASRIVEELCALQHTAQAIRRGQQALCADVADVQHVLARSGDQSGFTLSQIAFLMTQIASQTSRIDRFESRIDSVRQEIERRLV